MTTKRKFEILNTIESPGGAGPKRFFKVTYKAIENKKWIEGELFITGKNKETARTNAMNRFSGKE